MYLNQNFNKLLLFLDVDSKSHKARKSINDKSTSSNSTIISNQSTIFELSIVLNYVL